MIRVVSILIAASTESIDGGVAAAVSLHEIPRARGDARLRSAGAGASEAAAGCSPANTV